jgi:pimeloyl-ACP methyl ester carboxylesterase
MRCFCLIALTLAIVLGAAAAHAATSDAAETPVHVGQGAHTLYGSLITPAQQTSGAAVVIINGSGPGDRNGDDPKDGEKAHSTQLLALALAERGIASVRYDKRGQFESAAAGDPASIDVLASDAADWAKFLGKQPGVRCVVLLGHSEGALVATLAARKTRLCGVVLVSGTSRNLGDLILDQVGLAHLSEADTAKLRQMIADVRAGKPLQDVPHQYAGVFGPDALPFTRSEISLDPVAALAKVKVPVLVVQGDNDLQVKVEDAERLAAAKGVKPVIIPGMNHVLKLAPTKMVGNFLTYANPNLPLAPGLVEPIAEFVLARR